MLLFRWLTLIAAMALVCFQIGRGWAFSFVPLGDLPGGDFMSVARAVSDDGSTVVGESIYAPGRSDVFRWTRDEGMVGLGGLVADPLHIISSGVSGDGSVVVGSSWNEFGRFEAFRWNATEGTIGLGDPNHSFSTNAVAVSSDGLTVVGSYDRQGFTWTTPDGMVPMYPPGSALLSVTDVSGDGTVVVGTQSRQAFYWTRDEGAVRMGYLPGSESSGSFAFSRAVAISNDASVIAGNSDNGGDTEAFRWTSDGGMVGIGDLPGGRFHSFVSGISGDGSTIIGGGFDEAATMTGGLAVPFVWDEVNGMRRIDSILENAGIDLLGWELMAVNGVSYDGTVLVGRGRNPDGNIEGWLANIIPEPTTYALALTALCLAMGRRQGN